MLNINRNIYWSNLFLDFVCNLGLKYACISPGSRSTPLTYSFATNNRIKSFPIIDERSSAFFALGLSKYSRLPAIIITTSGTAVAETYPAIIEAYQSRTPLVICTADRPSRLRNTGANQTINQNNIFKNHIRFFFDIPTLDINKKNIKYFLNKIAEGFEICLFRNVGPIHFNFQFDKPFEPNNYTDKISIEIIDYSLKMLLEKIKSFNNYNDYVIPVDFNIDQISLITVGTANLEKELIGLVDEFSSINNIPIFADISSGLRFNKKSLKNLINNFDTILRFEGFQKIFKPEYTLHIGRNITSTVLEDYLIKTKSKRIIVNKFGDRFDTTKKGKILKIEPTKFFSKISNLKIKKNSLSNLEQLLQIDYEIEKIKSKVFDNTFTEVELFRTLIEKVPENSNLFIGNSLPIRDFDFFICAKAKEVTVFANRGASGIDGIISTAAGVAYASKKPTYLIIGDLSFYYDSNSLLLIKEFNIPLKIILINNQGGRIFDYLPISSYRNVFKKYFQTPIELNFAKLADVFELLNYKVDNKNDFLEILDIITKTKSSVILEIKINSLYTKALKLKFRKEVDRYLSKLTRDYVH
ncbi:MAG: 2-succinyl-5-enolpyruvyl-6-hydroxy-3-cyclohexene-1-carboxylic-acid synthase [Ignavibacterium sp.]|nr:2-succinyl-5-enolpyruvyl-6-hydroxy-3-cyclohexene-1-carboxylic-acid synthase [Ignavibacterium sp.]